MLKAELNNLEYEEFERLRKEITDAVTIDARTEEEFNLGTLKGAQNICYLAYDLADQLEQLDPDKSYFVFCGTGRRSTRICTILKNLGFKKLYNLRDGYHHIYRTKS